MRASADRSFESLVDALLRGLRRIEATGAIVSISVCGVLLIADVLGREVMGQGIPWAQRVAVYCATFAGMLGFSIAVQSGEHLRPRILDNLFPEPMRPSVGRFGSLLSAGVFLFLAYHSWLFVNSSAMDGYRGVALDIPVWPMQAILPYAFASAALRYAAYAAFPRIAPAEGEAEVSP